MNRILLDGDIYRHRPVGGIARYFAELARWFSENPAEDELFCMLPVNTPAEVVRNLPMRSAPRWMYSCPSFWRLLRPSVFHSTYYTSRPELHCPQVVTIYDFADAHLPAFCPNEPGFLERQIAAVKNADAVVAISESTKMDAVRFCGIPEDRIVVAYPGIAPVFAQDRPSIEAVDAFRTKTTGGSPFFLHVGPRGIYKNFTLLLEAFCSVAASSTINLLLSGGERHLSSIEEQLLIKHRMLDRVHLLGKLDDATLRLAYAGAEAMLSASLMEGFGIPVVEALACGGRVILSDIRVYREVAGDAAYFVNSYSLDAWIDTLRFALSSPLTVSESTRRETIAKYSSENAGQIHRSLYRNLIAQKGL